MKTLTQKYNKREFDYLAFLRKQNFARQELYDAYELSLDWLTCPSAQMTSKLQYNSLFAPKDARLQNMEKDFSQSLDMMVKWYRYGVQEIKHFHESRLEAMTVFMLIQNRVKNLL